VDVDAVCADDRVVVGEQCGLSSLSPRAFQPHCYPVQAVVISTAKSRRDSTSEQSRQFFSGGSIVPVYRKSNPVASLFGIDELVHLFSESLDVLQSWRFDVQRTPISPTPFPLKNRCFCLFFEPPPPRYRV
jgi:hypothetical protein